MKQYQTCFAQFEDDVEVIDKLLPEPEEFVRFIYDLPKVKGSMMLVTWFWRRWLAKIKIVTFSHMPCNVGRSLFPCVKSANYRACQWKLSLESFPEIPPPAGHSWTYSNGFPEPEWSDGPILPSQPDDSLEDAKHLSLRWRFVVF